MYWRNWSNVSISLTILCCLTISSWTWAADQADHPGHRLIQSSEMGFGFEIRNDWEVNLLPSGNLMISGQPGSESQDIMIVLQVIDKSSENTTLQKEMSSLWHQITALPKGQVNRQAVINVSGLPAPFMQGSYQETNSDNKLLDYQCAQWGVDRGDVIFLLGYSAPDALFNKYQDDFTVLSRSFKMQPLEGQTREAKPN